VRYLTLAEALVVAEAVTGIDAAVLAKMPGIGLLDSALHAPQAEFGDQEFYPDFIDKAAVLAVRIARNHSLPDGNKRLSWACPVLFCELKRLRTSSHRTAVPVNTRRPELWGRIRPSVSNLGTLCHPVNDVGHLRHGQRAWSPSTKSAHVNCSAVGRSDLQGHGQLGLQIGEDDPRPGDLGPRKLTGKNRAGRDLMISSSTETLSVV